MIDRREFFKKASKRLLPFVGVIAELILPVAKAKANAQFGCGWESATVTNDSITIKRDTIK